MKTTPRIGTIDGLIGCVGGGRVPVLPRYCTFRYTLEVGVTVVGRVITLNKAGSFEGRKGAMRKMLYVIVS